MAKRGRQPGEYGAYQKGEGQSEFGKHLHKLYKDLTGKKLSQTSLAQKMGIAPPTLTLMLQDDKELVKDDRLYLLFTSLAQLLEQSKVTPFEEQVRELLGKIDEKRFMAQEKDALYQLIKDVLRRLIQELIVRREYKTLQGFTFLGRDKDIQDIIKLLVEEKKPFLTIVGVAGVGKSELAWQVMTQEQIRREFLPLAPVSFADDSGKSVDEVKRKVTNALAGIDRQQKILLSLNDCEAIAGNEEAIGYLRGLFITYPCLTILATSRVLLPSSEKYPQEEDSLATLDVPEELTYDPKQLEKYDAIRLFCKSAQKINGKFRLTDQNAPDVANICIGLGGLPLAMIIAGSLVSRIKTKELYEMLLDRSIQGLETAVPQPQKRLFSLNALVGVSYELLDTKAQALFRRLSIFAVECRIETVATVCSLDNDVPTDPKSTTLANLLNTLVSHHLINWEDNWVNFAHVTLQDYSLQKLEESTDEAASVQQQFAVRYCHLADEFWPNWKERIEDVDREWRNFYKASNVVYELNSKYIREKIARLLGEECGRVYRTIADVENKLGYHLSLHHPDPLDWIFDRLSDVGWELTDEAKQDVSLYLAANEEAAQEEQLPYSYTNLFNIGRWLRPTFPEHEIPDEVAGMDIRELKARIVSKWNKMMMKGLAPLIKIDKFYEQALRCFEQGEYEQAEPLFKCVLELTEQHWGTEHFHTANSLNDLAVVYYRQQKYAEAEPLYQRAIAIEEKWHGFVGHPDTNAFYDNLIKLYRAQEKDEEAELLLQRLTSVEAYNDARERGYWKCDSCGSTKEYLTTKEEVEIVEKVRNDPQSFDYNEWISCPFCINGRMAPPKIISYMIIEDLLQQWADLHESE